MYGICRHLLASGGRCTQPAVNKTLYCRHHQVVKITLAKVAPKPDPYGIWEPLPFVFSEDRAALQLNFSIVVAALNDKRIDIRLANAFNRLFRSCEINLKKGPLHEPEREKKSEPRPARRNPNEKWLVDDEESEPLQDHAAMVRSVILTPDGEEIAPSRDVWEEDEEELHGEACPCQRCAEEYRGAPPEQHHPRCQCERCGPAKTEDAPSLTPATAAARACPEPAEGLGSKEPQSAPIGQNNSIELSSRPESASADAVEGPAIPQPSHESPSFVATLSVSSAGKSDLNADSEEERLKKLADEAREIFKQLGHPYEEPSTPGQEQRPSLGMAF